MDTSEALGNGHFRDFLDPEVDEHAFETLEPVSGLGDRGLVRAGKVAFWAIGARRIEDSADGQQFQLPNGEGGRVTLELTDPDRFTKAILTKKDVGLFYGYTGGSGDDILWRPNADLTDIPEDVDTGNPEADSLAVVASALYKATEQWRHKAWRAAKLVAPFRDRRAQAQWDASTERTRAEISTHYDLSQEVYNGEHGFLDSYGQYSSGLLLPGQEFEGLDRLQERKIDSLARKLELETADTLLEIGSGWGGLSVEFAKRYPNLHIASLTVSQEQLKIARKLAEDAGVSDRVKFMGADYRDFEADKFDRIVSIEMIEAVAWQDMPTYFDALAKFADPEKGVIVLQSINIQPEQFAHQKHNTSFANTAIFPGGMLTPKNFIKGSMAERGWRGHEDTELSPSYALTLREWLRNLEASRPALTEIWTDRGVPAEKVERFYRGFGFYLAFCEAAFRPEMSHLQNWQLTFRPEKIS